MKLAEWRLTIETDERDEVILDSACEALDSVSHDAILALVAAQLVGLGLRAKLRLHDGVEGGTTYATTTVKG